MNNVYSELIEAPRFMHIPYFKLWTYQDAVSSNRFPGMERLKQAYRDFFMYIKADDLLNLTSLEA